MMTINGGNGSGDVLNRLIAQLQTGSDAANTANLAQYKNLMNSVSSLTNNVVGKGGQFSQASNLLSNAGQTAIADTQQNTKNQVGAADQDLISRGLGNSTIRPNVLTGIQNKGQREVNAINENVAGQRAGLLTQQAGATMDLGRLNADSILSRQNQGPDMSMYLKLIQQLAASQTGGQQKMFSNAGSINGVNAPVQFSSTIGQQAPLSATAPRPGDTFFSNANNPSIANSPLSYRF